MVFPTIFKFEEPDGAAARTARETLSPASQMSISRRSGASNSPAGDSAEDVWLRNADFKRLMGSSAMVFLVNWG
jgi:hypothetical protein